MVRGRVEPPTFRFQEERADDPAYGRMSLADTFPLLDQNEPVKREVTAVPEWTDPATRLLTTVLDGVGAGWATVRVMPVIGGLLRMSHTTQ